MILHPSFVLPVMPGETPVGYASRLALRIGCSLRVFCSRIDLPLQKLLDGVPSAVQQLRDVCQLGSSTFADTTYVRAPGRRFMLAGETLSIDQVNRVTLRICPVCVDQQLADGRDIHEVWSPREWHLPSLHVCDAHGVAMVSVDIPRHHRQDFAGLLHGAKWRGLLLSGRPESVPESGLGQHIRRRLCGVADGHFLSGMPLYAAIKTAEMIGSTAAHGVQQPWRVGGAERFEAGRIGYDILGEGEAGLRKLFADLQSRSLSSQSGTAGLVTTFGRLYLALSKSEDTAYDPLRDVMRQHILETMPFGRGDMVLGQQVAERRTHSARTVAVELGIATVTALRRLRLVGVLGESGQEVARTDSTFDAQKHSEEVRRLATALQRADAGRYIGLKMIYEDVAPILDMVGSMNIDKANPLEQFYAKEDLDAFLTSLLSKASSGPADAEFEPMAQASKRARTSIAKIIDMILKGEITDIRLSPRHKGIMSVMVRKRDILAAVIARRPWLTLTAACKAYKMRESTLSALVRSKIIPSKGKSPLMLQSEDVEAFKRTYVTRREVSLRYGKPADPSKRYSVFQAIADAGLKPAFDDRQSRLIFFRRDDVIAALGPPPT